MFSLVSGLVKWLCAKEEVNVVIVGLDHAGKTTLLEQTKNIFSKGSSIPLDKIPPTVGMNVGRMDVAGYDVTFWDLGGQATMRAIWRQYVPDAHAILYVVDAAEPGRFAAARAELDKLLDARDVRSIPVLVFANKQDLDHAVGSETVSTALDVGRHTNRATRVQGVSALTCDGVKEGIQWLVEAASLKGATALAKRKRRLE